MDRPLIGRRGFIASSVLIISAVLFQGCGGQPKLPRAVPAAPAPAPLEQAPPTLRVEIAAASDANQGPGAQALPIMVRVYELKSQGVFATADFFSLYDRDAEVLGGDLIARDEVTLAPGQSLLIERPLNPAATYLGVVAAFRDIDHSRWRDQMGLNPGRDNRPRVEVGPKAVSIRHQ